MHHKILPFGLALLLVLSACGLNFSLPITQPTGPVTVDEIALPMPADPDETIDLSLAFGAGRLVLNPGSADLISGTATYNLEDLKPEVSVSGSSVRIEQGDWQLSGIPDITNVRNEWDFSLGAARYDLSIEAGAYQAQIELGGVALTNLTIQDGAADSTVSFSSANPVEMNLLRYETGASNVSLLGLSNANFSAFEFDSGAGNYTLDFSGQLQRSASVSIETGLSNLTLVIPAGIPVQITFQGSLSNVTHGPDWERSGNVYTQAGEGPSLTIMIEIGAGNLTLTR
jgi:hypothetical protein